MSQEKCIVEVTLDPNDTCNNFERSCELESDFNLGGISCPAGEETIAILCQSKDSGIGSSQVKPNAREKDDGSTTTIDEVSASVETPRTFSHCKGVLMAVSSSVFFTGTAVIAKYLKDVHPGETACFRFLGIMLFTIPMVLTAGVHPFGPSNKRHYLLLRGIAGATSLYMRYAALQYLPIANATVIILSMPVFVSIFARIFLKEACGLFHVMAIGVTLVGIGFTAKIGDLVGLTKTEGVDKNDELTGLLYSMGATVIGASVYIFVRKVKECHDSVILFNFSLVAVIESSILTGVQNGFSLPTGNAPWLLIALAVLSFYGQLLLTRALQAEEASIVSLVRSSSEVVCAFIFQIVIFNSLPDVYACIGALLVTSTVVLTSLRKWALTLPDNHRGRKWLRFTLI